MGDMGTSPGEGIRRDAGRLLQSLHTNLWPDLILVSPTPCPPLSSSPSSRGTPPRKPENLNDV